MTSSKVNQLQLLQQNLQNVSLQRQQFEMQISELDSALEELDKTEKTYKIIGKIMVASSKDVLKKELREKKEVVQVRVNHLVKQEDTIKSKMEETQKEAIEEMKNKK